MTTKSIKNYFSWALFGNRNKFFVKGVQNDKILRNFEEFFPLGSSIQRSANNFF